jgi:hypothetical protein
LSKSLYYVLNPFKVKGKLGNTRESAVARGHIAMKTAGKDIRLFRLSCGYESYPIAILPLTNRLFLAHVTL